MAAPPEPGELFGAPSGESACAGASSASSAAPCTASSGAASKSAAAAAGSSARALGRLLDPGMVVDWRDWDRIHDEAGLIPPKDHTPVQEEMYVYDADGEQIGFATSFMYSPVLQRHIGIVRVPPELVKAGSKVYLEVPVSHRYVHVAAETARLPLYNPERRTA